MSRRDLAAFAATCLTLGAPGLASAYSVTWCASVYVGYADSNKENVYDGDPPQTPEYFWSDATTTNLVAKAVRGAHYEVRNSSGTVILFQGELYDGINGTAGCTPALTLAGGTYDFHVRSHGVIQNNTLNVYNEDGAPNWRYVWKNNEVVSATGTKALTWTPAGETMEVFRVYQAAAWALYRHAGGMTETYTIEAGYPSECGSSGASCSNGSIGTSWIASGSQAGSPGQTDNKFIIVHELGHLIAYNAAADLGADFNYSYNGNGETIADACKGDTGSPGSSHEFLELEWVGAALGEGFADFYAADVWNNHDVDDCWFVAFSPTLSGLSCEVGSTGFLNAWVNGETCRTPDDPVSGERMDWMRILWDVHTNAVSDPTFTYILQTWLAAAAPWAKETAFTELDAKADQLGGTLDQSWLQAIWYNANYYCPDLACRQ